MIEHWWLDVIGQIWVICMFWEMNGHYLNLQSALASSVDQFCTQMIVVWCFVLLGSSSTQLSHGGNWEVVVCRDGKESSIHCFNTLHICWSHSTAGSQSESQLAHHSHYPAVCTVHRMLLRIQRSSLLWTLRPITSYNDEWTSSDIFMMINGCIHYILKWWHHSHILLADLIID